MKKKKKKKKFPWFLLFKSLLLNQSLFRDATEYKPGKENVAADSLSRSIMMAISQLKWKLIPKLKEALAQDTQLSTTLFAE